MPGLTRRRALLVTSVSPWDPSASGAQQRTALLYASLGSAFDVDVLLIREGVCEAVDPGTHPNEIGRLTWKQSPLSLYKYSAIPWLTAWCNAHIDWSRYELIVGRYLTPVSKVEWPRYIKTLVDCDDAYYRYPPEGDTITARSSAVVKGQVRLWQTRIALRRFDHAFFCTPGDQKRFSARSASVLPNVKHVDATRDRAPARSARVILIVGSMWYTPNQLGVDWFLRRCWPSITSRHPDVTLRIVGSAPAATRERWQSHPKTEAPGFIEDLSQEYQRAMFAVAPVHYGGGTCIKFLEAGAYGLPCVVTRYVFAGYRRDFQHGHSTLVAKDADGMARHCCTLAADPELRRTIGQNAHDVVMHAYNVGTFDSAVQAAVRAIFNGSETLAAG